MFHLFHSRLFLFRLPHCVPVLGIGMPVEIIIIFIVPFIISTLGPSGGILTGNSRLLPVADAGRIGGASPHQTSVSVIVAGRLTVAYSEAHVRNCRRNWLSDMRGASPRNCVGRSVFDTYWGLDLRPHYPHWQFPDAPPVMLHIVVVAIFVIMVHRLPADTGLYTAPVNLAIAGSSFVTWCDRPTAVASLTCAHVGKIATYWLTVEWDVKPYTTNQPTDLQ